MTVCNAQSRRRLSVLIPNHNYAAYIGQTIDSVLAQDYGPIELVVVDDGSTDGSVDVIEAALDRAGHLARTKLVALPRNRGKLGAINAVLDQLTGDYLITLDADDLLVPTYASRCIDVLEAERATDPAVGFVYSDCLLIDSQGEVIDRGRSTPFDADLLDQFSYVPEPAVVVTQAFLDVAPFDETIRVATKHHKWKRMVARGWTGHYLPEPLFHYRMHGNNLSGIGSRVTAEVAQGRRGERILSGYWTTAEA
ncbi:hypothetical protein CCR85_03395 [Rhodothalassium salexigens]|uniref:glycosyltransferase family 2 protein n=1 Tax=Rhodothalassium salexigens TaxID=1086 RepID=UPI0019112E7B|nr:glycosyltransferase [Rhodothalassium salexigens]MBK5910536.1 hypothetical protein [Rhodothalassium salexigens]MBK5919865.1 hypothetical protein [Rhodothalassium salexigens]